MIQKAALLEILEEFPEEFPLSWLYAALGSLEGISLTSEQQASVVAAAEHVERFGGTSLEDLKVEMQDWVAIPSK